jgi:hypothetical protein
VLWPLALQYGGVVAPAPGGGGFIEAAFGAVLGDAIPARRFGGALVWWRVYTFYAYVAARRAGGGAHRAARAARRGARHGGGAESPLTDVVGGDAWDGRSGDPRTGHPEPVTHGR